MKKNILSFLLYLCSFSVSAQKSKYPLEITHLKDNFYVYVSYGTYNGERYPANEMYLVTKKGVVLFDTPWGEQYYQPLLDSIWARPKVLLDTSCLEANISLESEPAYGKLVAP